MRTFILRPPSFLLRGVQELARREGVAMNQIIAKAVAEKLSALITEDYLEERAGPRRPVRFEAILRKVPNVEPAEWDPAGLDRASPRGHSHPPAASQGRLAPSLDRAPERGI